MTEKSLLKPFEPMLASPRGKLKFPCYVQPKYDGIRCVVLNGVAMSRNLEPIANALIRDTLSNPLFEGFDGELVDGAHDKDVYNRTNSTVMSADGDPTHVVFNVFDDFSNPRWQYQLRYLGLRARVDAVDATFVQYVPCLIAEDEDFLMGAADALFDSGYEGAIVRDMHAMYKHGRATESEGSMWKIKRMQDDEMLVIRCEERFSNQNEQTRSSTGKSKRSHAAEGKVGTGLLGVLVGTSPKWPGVEIRVGSSNLPRIPLDEAERMFFNKLVTFKHQPAGAKDAPRFPIYKSLRDRRDLG